MSGFANLNPAVLRFALEHTDSKNLQETKLPDRPKEDYEWLREALDQLESDGQRLYKMLRFLKGEIPNPFSGEKLKLFPESKELKQELKQEEKELKKESKELKQESKQEEKELKQESKELKQESKELKKESKELKKESKELKQELKQEENETLKSGKIEISLSSGLELGPPLFLPSPTQVVFVLEEMQYLCEDLDNANDFCKMEGHQFVMQYLDSELEDFRFWTSSLLATLAQNNLPAQLALLEKGVLNKIMQVIPKEPSTKVLSKHLSVLSSLVQTGTDAVKFFVQKDGLSLLTPLLQPSVPNPIPMKTIWLLRNLMTIGSSELPAKPLLDLLTLIQENLFVTDLDLRDKTQQTFLTHLTKYSSQRKAVAKLIDIKRLQKHVLSLKSSESSERHTCNSILKLCGVK